MNGQLYQYKNEMETELHNILNFWQTNTIDNISGGFYGKLDNLNKVYADAPKGAVLNCRILWTFSAAFNLTKKDTYLQTATRAFDYIRDHFIDKEHGGIYWTVDHKGEPLDTKKQIYALSFCVYALSEFYISTKNEEAKALAIDLYHAILKYSYDEENGGYIEALGRDWQELADLRLSKKDANEKKSMNTHLHVLEGFTNLYRVWANEELSQKIKELIYLFLNHIIDSETHHQVLFFDEKWNRKSNVVSYGHDIEAAWLVQEAAEVLGDERLIEEVKKTSNLIAGAAEEGLDKDGGLWYEYDVDNDHLIKEKHWWPQAEAMIGFFNSFQNTGDTRFLELSLSAWHFVKEKIIDHENGEWFWGITENGGLMDEDKAGLWKCPYHNGRACVELIKRIGMVSA